MQPTEPRHPPTGESRPDDVAFATIVTRNHLPRARVLMASARRFHPGARCHVLLVDGEPGDATDEADFTAHSWRELELRGYLRRAFVNSAGALCCMLKPVFAGWLLRRFSTPAVLYLDADTRLYASPLRLVRAALESSFVLTPHILSPGGERTALRGDAAIAKAGTYNGGLFAARNDPQGLAILDWWAEGMWREAWLDHAYAWDQIWLPLLRQLFPASTVFSDPSCNVAYWNLARRPLRLDADGWVRMEDGSPLVHFHFSLFDPERPELLVSHHAEKIPADAPAVARLCADYAAAIAAADADRVSAVPYGFSRFRDGAPVTRRHRDYFRFHALPLGDEPGDPFDPAYVAGDLCGWRSIRRSQQTSARLLRAVRRLSNRILPSA